MSESNAVDCETASWNSTKGITSVAICRLNFGRVDLMIELSTEEQWYSILSVGGSIFVEYSFKREQRNEKFSFSC